MNQLKHLAARWRAFWHRVGVIQTTAILAVLYFTVMAAMALVARLLRRDLLNPKPRASLRAGALPAEGFWLEREPAELELEALKRQF